MKRILRIISITLLLGVLVRFSPAAAPTTKPSAEGIDYFEKHIRPVATKTLSDKQKVAILGGNAAKLLGIKV